MFANYLLVSLRQLQRSKAVTLLKIFGLSLGFLCAIPVLMHLQQALDMDSHFTNADNIYRLALDFDQNDRHVAAMTSSAAYEPALRQEFPQIRHGAVVREYYGMFTRNGTSSFSTFAIASPEVADIFSLQFVAGDRETALSEPSSIVLSESSAARLFPDGDALGQTLTFDEMADFKVTGIIRDLPANTHFALNMLVSVETMQKMLGTYFMASDDWGQFAGTVIYLAFDDAAAARQVAEGLPGFVARHTELIQDGNTDMRNIALSLEPLRDIYLGTRQVWGGQNPRTQVFGYSTQPRAQILASLGIFAVLILATACVNFTSLSLSQLQQLQHQTGVRRTLGARSRDIAMQCLLETIMLSVLALLLALPCVYLVLPAYSVMTGTQLTAGDLLDSGVLLQLGILAIATGLLSGALPVFRLTRFKPVTALGEGGRSTRAQRLMLKFVSGLQFSISMTLIMFALAVQLQVDHLGSAEPGFDKRDLVLFDSTFNWDKQDLFDHRALTAELAAHPGVLAVGGTNLPLPLIVPYTRNVRPESAAPDAYSVVPFVVVDGGFIDALQVPLLAGRNFPKVQGPDDGNNVLVTRTTAAKLGFATPQGAVDQLLLMDFGSTSRIIGVIDDIRSAGGLEDPAMSPGLFMTYGPPKTYFLLRLDPTLRDAALQHIQAVWERYRPGVPLNLRFYERIYADVVAERTRGISKAATFASVITVLISVLGIQALAFHSGERRLKEVGIRKVLGATSASIILLIAWDLLKPVLVAALIAWDLSGQVIEQYFNQFTSRAEIPLVLYPVLTLAVLLLVGLSTALQIYRTAGQPPVRALRYE